MKTTILILLLSTTSLLFSQSFTTEKNHNPCELSSIDKSNSCELALLTFYSTTTPAKIINNKSFDDDLYNLNLEGEGSNKNNERVVYGKCYDTQHEITNISNINSIYNGLISCSSIPLFLFNNIFLI